MGKACTHYRFYELDFLMKNNNFTYGMVIKKREKEDRKIISTDSV